MHRQKMTKLHAQASATDSAEEAGITLLVHLPSLACTVCVMSKLENSEQIFMWLLTGNH